MLINEVDFDLLRSFVVVASARTFAEAAATLRITPSAVSHQMKVLEAQLGQSLFERHGRRARTTPAGVRLAQSVRACFTSVEAALEEVDADRLALRGVVRVGGPGPLSRAFLLPKIAALLEAHPEIVLELSFGVPSALVKKLAEGSLDLLVCNRDAGAEEFVSRPLLVEEFVAVVAPSYVSRMGKPRDAAALASHRFIVFDADLAMHAAWWRASFGARAPMRFVTACRVGNLDAMLSLAERGVGITVLPNYFVETALAAKRVATLDVGTRRPARNPIVASWRRGTVETARFCAVRDALLA